MFTGSGLKFVAVWLACITSQAAGQTIVEPLDQVVALAGVIKEVHGYGPPGYGENKKTDSPITYFVLEVPTPVKTMCTPEKPEWESMDCRTTRRLRLFFPTYPLNNGLERKAREMKNHKVVLSGVLHRQDTLGQITPIYMDVTEVQPVRSHHKRRVALPFNFETESRSKGDSLN